MSNSFPVCIFGSRTVKNYNVIEFIERRCNFLNKATEIITAKASGADKLGELYADKWGLPKVEFPADWDDVENKPEKEIGYHDDGTPYWKKAGHFRNLQMVDYILKTGGGAIGIWDKSKILGIKGSKGTKNMVSYCWNIEHFFCTQLMIILRIWRNINVNEW